MRGRPHAIGAAFVCGLLPPLNWLGSAIVSLVLLRRGASEGGFVLMWAALPIAVGVYLVGDPTPALMLLSGAIMAYLLRITLSWEVTIVAAMVMAGLGSFVLQWTGAEFLKQFVQVYLEYLKESQLEAAAITEADATRVILSLFAMGQSYILLLILVLARWWQSVLYNPGGFREEFHSIRLSPTSSSTLVVLMLVCIVFSEQLGRWLPLLSVPLIFSAVALVHWLMARRNLSGGWTFAFYFGLIVFYQLLYPVLASMALVDSWLDIRSRMRPPGPPAPLDEEPPKE